MDDSVLDADVLSSAGRHFGLEDERLAGGRHAFRQAQPGDEWCTPHPPFLTPPPG
jgi:hypothetical protein